MLSLHQMMRQPQSTPEINFSHKLAKDLSGCFVLNGGKPRDLVTGWTNSGSRSWVTKATTHGLGQYPSTTYTGAQKIFLNSNSPTSAMVIASPEVSGTGSTLFSQRPSGGGMQISFLANMDAGGSKLSGQLSVFTYGALTLTAASAVTGVTSTYGYSFESHTKGTIYVDGAGVPTTSSSTGYPIFSFSDFNIGMHAGYGALATTPIVAVFLWNRTLTADEHKEMAENPWQIFKGPATPIFTPIGDSGVLIPDLSSPGVIDITNSSARPELNVQY